MSTAWRFGVLAVLVCAAIGCSDDDEDTGPAPEQLTGIWNATKVEYVSVPPASTVELIGLGGSATLTLDDDGTFEFVVTPSAEAPETTEGTWDIDGDMMSFTPQGMPFSWQFDVTLADDSLELNGASVEYDFNGDDTPEQAKLYLTFVR